MPSLDRKVKDRIPILLIPAMILVSGKYVPNHGQESQSVDRTAVGRRTFNTLVARRYA
jgi:hypothetical protein